MFSVSGKVLESTGSGIGGKEKKKGKELYFHHHILKLITFTKFWGNEGN